MESVTRVRILNESVCFTLCVNALGKGMNPSMWSGKLIYLALVQQRENCLNIDFLSDLLRGGGAGFTRFGILSAIHTIRLAQHNLTFIFFAYMAIKA